MAPDSLVWRSQSPFVSWRVMHRTLKASATEAHLTIVQSMLSRSRGAQRALGVRSGPWGSADESGRAAGASARRTSFSA